MEKDIAVKIEGIGKKYVIGDSEKYLALRDIIVKAIKAPINLLKGKGLKKKKEFWALKDINLEVERGDVVGIIGRNGAGKSTLLKILSRITEPTEGSIKYHGKVSSLLEVGTGFHPELTGRENVYLNGAILGMSRKEIEKKFNEIVEFSGVKEFIDMPVKRYSSGMQVRLAFSVAANLDSDILVIDEVLAVGDAEFQKKCLGKMDEVTKDSGRTIFFVSHDMGAIRRICNKVVLLDNGRITAYGKTDDIVNKYLDGDSSKGSRIDIDTISNRPGDKSWTIKELSFLNNKNSITDTFHIGEDLSILFSIINNNSKIIPSIGVVITREDGVRVVNMADRDVNYKSDLRSRKIRISINDNRLYPGKYFVSVWLGSSDGRDVYDYAIRALAFEIINTGKYTSRQLPLADGIILLNPIWKNEKD